MSMITQSCEAVQQRFCSPLVVFFFSMNMFSVPHIAVACAVDCQCVPLNPLAILQAYLTSAGRWSELNPAVAIGLRRAELVPILNNSSATIKVWRVVPSRSAYRPLSLL